MVSTHCTRLQTLTSGRFHIASSERSKTLDSLNGSNELLLPTRITSYFDRIILRKRCLHSTSLRMCMYRERRSITQTHLTQINQQHQHLNNINNNNNNYNNSHISISNNSQNNRSNNNNSVLKDNLWCSLSPCADCSLEAVQLVLGWLTLLFMTILPMQHLVAADNPTKPAADVKPTQ